MRNWDDQPGRLGLHPFKKDMRQQTSSTMPNSKAASAGATKTQPTFMTPAAMSLLIAFEICGSFMYSCMAFGSS